jgi:hypothetical protein
MKRKLADQFGKFGFLQMFAADGGEGGESKSDQSGTEKKDAKDNQDGGTKKSLEDILKEHGLEKDFESQLQSIADKRVTDAIKKTTDKLTADFQAKQAKEKMTEDEKRVAEEAEKQRAIDAKLRDAAVKELKYNLVDYINEEGLDLGFRDLIDVSALLGVEDEDVRNETLKKQVKATKKIVDSLVDKKVEDFKTEFLKGKSPSNQQKGNNTPPTAYDQAKEKGSVKDMLKARFAAKE